MIFPRFFFYFLFFYTHTSFFLVVSAARGHVCRHCKYCLQSIQRKWSIVNHRNNLQLKLPLPFTCVRVCFLFFSLFLPVHRVIIGPSGLPELPECFFVTPSLWLNNTMVNNVGEKNEKKRNHPDRLWTRQWCSSFRELQPTRDKAKLHTHVTRVQTPNTVRWGHLPTTYTKRAKINRLALIHTCTHTHARSAAWCCNGMSLPLGQSNHLKEKHQIDDRNMMVMFMMIAKQQQKKHVMQTSKFWKTSQILLRFFFLF